MRKCISIINIFIIIGIISVSNLTFAMGSITGEFNVLGGVYVWEKKNYSITLTFKTIDYSKQSFTASFSVDGDNPYSENITGTIQKDRVWASSSDYEYNISRLKLIGKTAVITALT